MAKVRVDMSKADGRAPIGDYICLVTKVELKNSKSSGKPCLYWTLKIGIGEHKGDTIMHNTSLVPKALFKLRETLEAMGIKVPKSTIEIDTDKYIKKIIGVTIGKTKGENGEDTTGITALWKPEKVDGQYRKPKGEDEETASEQLDDEAPFETADEDDEDVDEIEV